MRNLYIIRTPTPVLIKGVINGLNEMFGREDGTMKDTASYQKWRLLRQITLNPTALSLKKKRLDQKFASAAGSSDIQSESQRHSSWRKCALSCVLGSCGLRSDCPASGERTSLQFDNVERRNNIKIQAARALQESTILLTTFHI